MAFHISVYRAVDDGLFSSPPADVNSAEFGRWFDLCNEQTLFDYPLGSDGTVYDFWCMPAARLKLPLIGRVYRHGLKVQGDELAALGAECDSLEAYWGCLDFAAEPPFRGKEILEDGTTRTYTHSAGEHLAERMAALREAIATVVAQGGVLSIT
jgi:hypothetical protein